MESAEVFPEYTPAHLRLDSAHLFRRYGYMVIRPADSSGFAALQRRFSEHLLDGMAAIPGMQPQALQAARETFVLPKYHDFISRLAIDHHALIKSLSRHLPVTWCGDPYVQEMVRAASVALGSPVKIYNDKMEFRVVRPRILDNNPLHRDHWFPYFTPLINIYLPICGSHCDSALKVIPGSHEWSDDEVVPSFAYGEGKKTVRDGVAYSVPEIKSCSRDLAPHRPDIIPGDFMIFSPKTVHGGSDNQSLDTRFSFEIRLEYI